ncbi:MAG: tetratricopeptide repeat protein, partial [Ardenticatenaceae bacterium]|nr:tetratricopeptide repeat protein [Ardenticatenaceae bacterium]
MADRLLQTKLFIPSKRPFLIPRARLHQQLDGGRDGRVTLVAAPAGFGKTTLVTSWLAEQTTPHAPYPTPHIAWLSLDEHDNDPGRFLAYLLAAIQTVCPTVVGLLPGNDEWQPRDLEAAMEELLNELAGEKRPFFLTLDDYHLITNPHSLHDRIGFFCGLSPLHSPPHSHQPCRTAAVSVSPLARDAAVPTTSSRWTSNLTAEEAAAFLRQTGAGFGRRHHCCPGSANGRWVAGPHATPLLRAEPETPPLSLPTSPAVTATSPITCWPRCTHQPPEVQVDFAATAVLDRLTGDLCDALLSRGAGEQGSRGEQITPAPLPLRPPAASLLHHLETHNLFLIPLDNERRWYRYHHLFGQLLRQRLRQERGETAVRDLHRRAAQWHEQHGELETAVFHTLQAHDHDEAARLVATLNPGNLWAPDSMGLLQQWGEAIPAASLQRHPRAAILVASAHMISGAIPACLQFLQLVTGETAVFGETNLLQAIITRNEGNIPQALTLVEQALTYIPTTDHILRWVARMQLASCQQELGHIQQAENTMAAILRQMRQQSTTDLSIKLQAVRFLAAMQAMQGDLFQAQRQYEEGLVLAQSGSLSVTTGLMHLGLGELSYQWNELDKAAAAFAEAHRWGRRTGMTDIMIGVYLGQMDLACQRRDVAELEALIEQLTAYVVPSQMPTIINMVATMVQLYRLRLWRVDGGKGLATAVRWVNASGLKLTDE